MRRLVTFVAALIVLGAPAAMRAQEPARLSPADSALVERLTAQYKAAGEAKDWVEAVRIAVRIGTISKNGALLHKMGHYYEAGSEQIPKDDAEAVRVFTLAADLGDAEAQHHIAMRHFQGRGVELDSSRGADLMEKSAEQGYGPARTEWRKLEAAQALKTAASEKAVQCAKAELERIGYFELSDAGEIFRGETTFLRIREKAPSMAELRGDAVTVDGPSRMSPTGSFDLKNVTGFIGVTEKALGESKLMSRSLDRRVTVSRQGADEIEGVRALCTPR
jgi:TPR repeat protein